MNGPAPESTADPCLPAGPLASAPRKSRQWARFSPDAFGFTAAVKTVPA